MQHPDPAVGIWAALILIGILLCLYFLPSIVAFERKHNSRVAILVLNLLLGWTCLGWIAALVWSFTSDTQANKEREAMLTAALINGRQPPPNYPPSRLL